MENIVINKLLYWDLPYRIPVEAVGSEGWNELEIWTKSFFSSIYSQKSGFASFGIFAEWFH